LVLARLGLGWDIERALGELPIRLCVMDARELEFETDSFDLVWSGACLEHVTNVGAALAEMARVLRPGGRMYHRIDPFFWVRGCHLPGLVDVPWAHARLSPDEYRRLMLETHGTNGAAARINFVQSLNQFTVRQWRDVFDSAPVKMIRWKEERLDWVVDLLGRHPEVTETTIKGVEPTDLTCSMITAVASFPK
jgi:SAM-dependent methyltransferase